MVLRVRRVLSPPTGNGTTTPTAAPPPRRVTMVGCLALLLLMTVAAPAVADEGFQVQIYNGEPAEIADLPPVVYIESGDLACTGTVVAAEWILTAAQRAHCFSTSRRHRCPTIPTCPPTVSMRQASRR